MKTATIREKLHDYLEKAEDKKIKAIYTMVEDEIEEDQQEKYSNELKKILDQRYEAYKKDGKVISESEAKKRIEKVLKAIRKK
jgi:hypothetical protein